MATTTKSTSAKYLSFLRQSTIHTHFKKRGQGLLKTPSLFTQLRVNHRLIGLRSDTTIHFDTRFADDCVPVDIKEVSNFERHDLEDQIDRSASTPCPQSLATLLIIFAIFALLRLIPFCSVSLSPSGENYFYRP